MALISQAGPYCSRNEIIQSKTRDINDFSMPRSLEAPKMKDDFVGLSTLSCISYRKKNNLHMSQGHGIIVAASPPTEDAVVVAEPLTKEDLVAYLASGCKSKEKWR